ncbi:hypothetical protein Ccur_01130 [Cryptobacterium curtum DSM 15641]|uniref:Glycosyltransferase n=1 Tax=Cryptobacterium curtum (strain ATCC 700683 / DSM 15641 / CCUG 43107 / 12-3) TaxID=469378 RepID=C7MLP0_CRYCD|nr:hypothetical protein [Cryptobacterium curtum]ACU93846.1 hypothetical protein Ccur_01130 [Cryptobacterium curtum DSM 15641]
MNPLLIIPTYVSARSQAKIAPVAETYDHMTPLQSPGELARCLKSLMHVQGVGQIAVLVVSETQVAAQAARKVRAICEQFPLLNTIVIGQVEESLIKQRFKQLNLTGLDEAISLHGYSAMRNLGLIVAGVFGFDSVVFIDDDEVVDDSEFLVKGMYGLGKLTRRGIPILAKSGYFLDKEGSVHSKRQDRWYDRFWMQGSAFNRWIDSALRGPRLSRSNHVCGGCLALHREAYRRVCFDPWIVRGEDLDYLLNLRMYGSDIWFDNQWHLRHLPPKTPSEGLRFRQDIYRWIYEFRKMEYSRTQIDLQQIKPSSLEPYPGPLLEPGITKRIKRTALLRSLARPDKAAYRRAARVATSEATVYAERCCSKYFEFQFIWPEAMHRIEDDGALRDALLQHATVGSDTSTRPVTDDQVGRIDPGATSEIRLNMAD